MEFVDKKQGFVEGKNTCFFSGKGLEVNAGEYFSKHRKASP
jgi:hypothetical protein